VRDALATLPWVEKDSIEASRSTKKVVFGIKDKSQFDLDKLKATLSKKYQTGLRLEDGPR
jgi:hypothetical protein